ncbi:DUF2935 domain-containing protein [Staphylospora marina]|uniref:DUF2935 domain-containing protein n=1 Tax=Staphylospora marina TaxID=2490858 RepID=UPI000F5C0A3D|nr:DUF2935 domain-containing protein [Staphylospora marina]
MKSLAESIRFEQGFWLEILKDHCQFIHDSLAPSETEEIQRAQTLYHSFANLIARSPDDLEASKQAALQLREFKLHLIRRLITGMIGFHLTPTFINHMVNELDEYLRILEELQAGRVPALQHPLHHHLLWLPDASGHAGAIADRLDPVEKKLRHKGHSFSKTFDAFYLKAVEFAGYLRTSLDNFPALKRFNKEVELEILVFQSFLKELEEMKLDDEALVLISPLMADHMYREECYYLTKLSEVSDVKRPNCSPLKR